MEDAEVREHRLDCRREQNRQSWLSVGSPARLVRSREWELALTRARVHSESEKKLPGGT